MPSSLCTGGPLELDVKLALKSLQMGLARVLVEPVSQEWEVRGSRTKTGFMLIVVFHTPFEQHPKE